LPSRTGLLKPDIHPDYRPVVLTSERTVEWEDGHTYPVVVDISASSHPFWTGSRRHSDTAGQVEEFRRRYGSRA